MHQFTNSLHVYSYQILFFLGWFIQHQLNKRMDFIWMNIYITYTCPWHDDWGKFSWIWFCYHKSKTNKHIKNSTGVEGGMIQYNGNHLYSLQSFLNFKTMKMARYNKCFTTISKDEAIFEIIMKYSFVFLVLVFLYVK